MLEQNKIYLGDCLELMKEIEDKSISTIICDLPYGTTPCKWDTIIPFKPLWEQYKRILKDNGVVVLFGSQPFSGALVMSNPDWFKESLVWEKHRPSNFGNAKYRHLKYHEDILIFAKDRYTYNPQRIKRESPRIKDAQRTGYVFERKVKADASFTTAMKTDANILDAETKYPSTILTGFYIANNAKEKVKHPTQKPEKLYEYLIKTFSNEGDLILDNCCGSGTIGIAKTLGRSFIGIEKQQEYYDIAVNRVSGYIYEQ